ncbi:MAG: type II toxin-antitoxin system YafQ family toxin [Planctomycetota bacterium]
MSVIHTTRFNQDLKRIKKRGYNTQKLREIIINRYDRRKLHKKHKDHKLRGKLTGCRECRVDPETEPDWLLIYWYDGLDLILERTGSHSELFKQKQHS